MDARDKYFRIKNFPTHFCLSFFLECFGENLTKIGDIYIPYKFAQSGCIPLKIKCKILAIFRRRNREWANGEWRMGIYVVQQSQLKVEGVNVEE